MLCNSLMKNKVNANYIPIIAFGMSIFIFDLSTLSLPIQSDLYNLEQFFGYISGWRVVFDLLALAICGGLYIVPLYVILQTSSDDSSRSRIIAANNLVNTLFILIYSIVLSILIKKGVEINSLFLITAILNGIVTLYMCKLLPEVTIKFLLRQILKLFYRVELKGIENYTNVNERALIIANHTSFLDAVLIAAFLPGKVTFAINTYIAKKLWIRPFLSLVNTLALNPTNPMAIKQFIRELESDKKCVIFPEGRITETGSIMKIYEGTAMIADKTNAKIIPIQIEGAQYSPFSKLIGKVKIKLFPKITITILPTQSIFVPKDITGKERRAKLAIKMYDIMSSMSFSCTNHNKTLFTSLLESKDINGGGHLIAEDINREPISYKNLITKSFVLGRYLSRNTSNKYVGILLPNMISSIVTFFSLQAFSRIPAMINYSSGPANVISACQTVKLKQIISSRQFIEKTNLQPLVTEIENNGCRIIYLEDLKEEISITDKIIGFFISFCPSIYYKFINSAKKLRADNPCVVLFTSGSEGVPKAVVLSHKNIQTNRGQLASRIDFGPSDIVFNALPIFHSFGLTAGTLLPMLSGVKVFFYPSPLHYRIIPELVYDTNSTIMFGTSTFLQNYAKYAHPYDFYSIRYIFSGAEKLKEEVYRLWLEKFGIKIFEGYGATETSPIISANTPMHSKFGSVGRIMPGMVAKLEEVAGVTEGKRLFVSGDNIMLGYILHEKPGVLTPLKDAIYDTGDIVYIDDEDYIYIKGRAKRFAKIAGEMVSLTAVEGFISALWPNFIHAVLSTPDDRKGEQLILVTTNKDAVKQEISNYAQNEKIGKLSVPANIIIVDKIPLLGTGKTDYIILQQQIIEKFQGIGIK
jgi:acyl-[acyl-carrier-protein]-phospholipid O-acyltransferase / long-chain-fatty-acid--[acyl-carrier-protein] ligase